MNCEILIITKGMRKIASNQESGITDGDEQEQVKGGDEL